MVKASNLRGRGGAGFPTGLKWFFLPKDHPGPIYMCINADESEPGTFNNRILMEDDPHQVLEGIIISCFATRAQTAYIYLRYEYPLSYERLQAAIDELYAKNLLGKNILGKEFSLDIFLHRGAAAYICGEETGLIESLEGKRAWPRIKPPFPAVEGVFRKPTVVNNIETACCVTQIIARGVDWFKEHRRAGRSQESARSGQLWPEAVLPQRSRESARLLRSPAGHHLPAVDRRFRRRRLEGSQGQGGHSRRHQHGPAVRSRTRHAARFRRPGTRRLPGPGHGRGGGARRNGVDGRLSAQQLPSFSPTKAAASVLPAARERPGR